MRIIGEISGKTIIDAAGNEIGKCDDVEIDWDARSMAALVVKGKGLLSKQFSSEKIDTILKKLRLARTDDLLIPIDEIQAVGKYIVLTREIETKESK